VQTLLIGKGLHVGDRDSPVSDRDRHIDQHPTRVVTGAAFPQPVGGLAQQRGQPDPVRQLGQQHSPCVRHHTRPVTGDDRLRPARCTLHLRSASSVWVPWTVASPSFPYKEGTFALSGPVSQPKIRPLLQQRG